MSDRELSRIHEKVVLGPSGCWVFCGSRTAGYGKARWKGKSALVHRVMYEVYKGEPPDELDHLCRNRACCNPEHLEPVTHQENVRRGSLNRPDTCRNGHPRTADLRDIRGRRVCRGCVKAAKARYWAKRRSCAIS